MAIIHTITCIMDDLLENVENKKSVRGMNEDDMKFVFAAQFFFATMWAFGGIVGDDVGKKSYKLLESEMKSIIKPKMPETGSCLDYYFDVKKKDWASWSELVPEYMHDTDKI